MMQALHYRLLWQSGASYPGAHPGQILGGGQLFKRHEPLIARPDPRRIDLRASVLDPFHAYRVRAYQQQSSVDVYLLADLSASMSFVGAQDKKQTVTQLISALADSAFSYGDKFGFIGCGVDIEQTVLLPASRQAGRLPEILKRLKTMPASRSAAALQKAAAYLPARRCLLFLVSDLHFPLTGLQAILGALQNHDVVPLVLWDECEYQKLPDWGLINVQDMESAQNRLLFMRPALRQKIITAYGQRQQAIQACCRGFGCEPLFLTAGFNAQDINHYFQQRAA